MQLPHSDGIQGWGTTLDGDLTSGSESNFGHCPNVFVTPANHHEFWGNERWQSAATGCSCCFYTKSWRNVLSLV